MRLPRLRAALAAGALLALGGCAGVPVVDNVYYDVAYVPFEYSGEVPVLVKGDPYRLSQAETERAAVAALQGATFGAATHLVAAPEGAAPVRRLVLLFNPPPALGSFQLCSRPAPPDTAATAPAARVAVIAALCRGDKAMTYAEGSIASGAGPTGPEFRDGVVRFALALMPPRNPGDTPGGGEFPN